MQHILIPTDFSKNAWNATSYALAFFMNQKTTFHFLNVDISMQVNSNQDFHLSGISVKNEISPALELKMENWIQRVYACCAHKNHTYKKAITKASFVDGIRSYISNHNIEFVVMGTKGASGLKEITIGSKTGSVITRVHTPILIIPEKASFKKPLNIGFPTDFNINHNHKIVSTLRTIAQEHLSSIKVLRVAQTKKPLTSTQNNNREGLKQNLLDYPHSFHVIENPNLADAIQSFVTTMQIDLVAMVAKNLNFYQRILFRPQVEKISYHITIPFLILHE
ncbi:universal stress protein [unidentified eubacterium SCB49]|nr:universal stress protein [unidentified eubacterium SCB49]